MQVFSEVRGGGYRLPGPGECKALVLLFIAHDCPISNGYAPEINRLCRQYESRSIAFCIVYAEPGLPIADARQHVADFGFLCPAILDPDLQLSARVGVDTTPEAAVLSPSGTVLYRGRIDDRNFTFAKQRVSPIHCELRNALDDVLAARPVAVPRSQTLGCAIPYPTHMENQ